MATRNCAALSFPNHPSPSVHSADAFNFDKAVFRIMSRRAFVLFHLSHNIRNHSFLLLMGSLAMVLHKDNSRLWRNVIPHHVLVGLHGGVIQGLCGDMPFRCLVIHETSDSMRLRCRRARLRWSLVPKPCGNPCYFLCKASELISFRCPCAQRSC